MSVAPLPDLHILDTAGLRDMVVKQHAQISSRDAELERLRLIIARLRRPQYGRKSEKIERQIEQLELQLEDLEAHAQRRSSYRRSTRWRPRRLQCLLLRHASLCGGHCRIIFPGK
jgi:hypothetical protein